MAGEYKEQEEKMQRTLDNLSENYATLRAGRANASVLNKITVDYKISSGWKLNGGDALWGYINREGQNTEMLSWKKGKAINLSSDFTDAVVAINLVNKKTGDKFFYMIFITP